MTFGTGPPPLPPPPPRPPRGPGLDRRATVVLAAVIGACLFAGGLVTAFLVLAEDEEGASVDVAREDDEPTSSPEADPAGEPPDSSPIQATMMFTDGATPQQLARIEQEWQDNTHLYGVIFLSAEELEEELGFNSAGIAALGDEEDRNAIRRFVCGYEGDPAVALAGLEVPCNEMDGAPDVAYPATITVYFNDRTPREHREAVRRAFEQNPLFDSVELLDVGRQAGPWNHITGSGDPDDEDALCDFGRQYLDDPTVALVESGGTNACPDL